MFKEIFLWNVQSYCLSIELILFTFYIDIIVTSNRWLLERIQMMSAVKALEFLEKMTVE